MRLFRFRSPVLLIAFLVLSTTTQAAELLKNRKFTGDDFKPWHLYVNGYQYAFESVEMKTKKGELRVKAPQATHGEYLNLYQEIKLKSAIKYKFSIEAKTDDTKAVEVQGNIDVGRINHPHTPYGLNQAMKLEKDWKTFEFEFTSDEIEKDNPAVLRLSFGTYGGAVYFRSPSLESVK